jgi:hypothetical protein
MDVALVLLTKLGVPNCISLIYPNRWLNLAELRKIAFRWARAFRRIWFWAEAAPKRRVHTNFHLLLTAAFFNSIA